MKKNGTKVTRKDLTELEERFCQEFHKDLNVSDAYRRAGGSSKNAASIGCRMIKRPQVRARITELVAGTLERTKIDADWLLTRLAAEANADFKDLFDEKENLLPIRQWPLIWRQGLIQGFEVEEITIGKDGTSISKLKKVKMGDRMRRLDSIGRHVAVGAYKDFIEVTGIGDKAADRIESAIQERESLSLELKRIREKNAE